MKKIIVAIATMAVFTSLIYADGESIAKSLSLDASSKAIKQWEKIFTADDKMAKMGIDKLSAADKEALKKYLTGHAADSDHPQAAGK